MFTYSKRRLREIAENYDEYRPRNVPDDYKRMTACIEFKADFDRAFGVLSMEQQRLIFDVYTYRIIDRERAIRKMRDFLNGKVNALSARATIY